MQNSTRNKKLKAARSNVDSVTKNAAPEDSMEERQNIEVNIDGKGTEDFSMLGHYITKEYELLRLVLSYLPLRDLYSASQVCKMWQSAVDVIKRSRNARLQWLLWHCQMKALQKEEVPYLMFSQHFFSEPQLCLTFMTRQINNNMVNCRRAKAPCPQNKTGVRCNSRHRVIDYMRAELQDCPCILVEGYGVVGSSHNLSLTVEVEENYNAYSSMLFPKAPGLTIKVFYLSMTECVALNDRVAINVNEMTGIDPSVDPIRCLLLFCKDRYSKVVDKLVAGLETSQGSRFAVGGGFFDRISLGDIAPMNERRHICIVGVAFMGENVRATSTILGSNVEKEEQVVEAMDELRLCNLPAQDSVGFMFACVGRGLEWYLQDNVESACFRHHFPSTPLVGFFGAGEIGRRFLPGNEKKSQVAKISHPDQHIEDGSLIHSYTTIFVYLTFSRQAST